MKKKILCISALIIAIITVLSVNAFAYEVGEKIETSKDSTFYDYYEGEKVIYCGEALLGENTFTVNWKLLENNYKFCAFGFTPDKDGFYQFYSFDNTIIDAVFDENGYIVEHFSCSFDEDESYSLCTLLESGKNYIIPVYSMRYNFTQKTTEIGFDIGYIGKVKDVSVKEGALKNVVCGVDICTYDFDDESMICFYDNYEDGYSVKIDFSEGKTTYFATEFFCYEIYDSMKFELKGEIKPGKVKAKFTFFGTTEEVTLELVGFNDYFKELRIENNGEIIEYYDCLSCQETYFAYWGIIEKWHRFEDISSDWSQENTVEIVFANGETATVDVDGLYSVVAPNGREYYFNTFDCYTLGNDKVVFCVSIDNEEYSNFLRTTVEGKRKATFEENLKHMKDNLNKKNESIKEDIFYDGVSLDILNAYFTSLPDELVNFAIYYFKDLNHGIALLN